MRLALPRQETSCGKERWFWVASPQAFWRTPLICLSAPGLLLIGVEWLSVSRWGFELLTGVWSATSLAVMAALVGVLVFPFVLLSKKRRRNAALGLLSSVACILSFLLGAIIGEQIRRHAFIELAERSKPLIQAIQTHEARFGRPPAALESLVPEFLPEVPSTGMGAYPTYRYVVDEEAKRFNNNPWALYVFTPSGGINFDQFMYFPLQNYPASGYGGWLERIGDWAYVHE